MNPRELVGCVSAAVVNHTVNGTILTVWLRSTTTSFDNLSIELDGQLYPIQLFQPQPRKIVQLKK